ncbi:MAG: peroxiredoxin [Polyangiales bacterium]
MLKVGDPAPHVSGRDQGGKPVALGDLWAQGPVVLFFYPKDFTPVCTREACHFRDAYGDLRARGVQVVGVSDDDPESHLRFQEAHQLPYPLLTDEGRAMANAFGLRGTLGLWPGASRSSSMRRASSAACFTTSSAPRSTSTTHSPSSTRMQRRVRERRAGLLVHIERVAE